MKQLAKAAVRHYWLVKLRVQAHSLTSLKYLRTGFLGLVRCHPLFRTCGASPREVEKDTTLTGHWEGLCTLPDCWGSTASHKGTVESFSLSWPSLSLMVPCGVEMQKERKTLSWYTIIFFSALYWKLICTRWVTLMIQLGKFVGGWVVVADTNYLYPARWGWINS